MYKLIVLFAVLVSVLGTSVPYPGKAVYKDDYEKEYVPPQPYNFEYAVKDEYDDFSRKEESDGKVVKGSYHVVLPDGRKQIVTYTADPVLGFSADVQYEGEAKYPEDTPYSRHAAKDAYNPPSPPKYPGKA